MRSKSLLFWLAVLFLFAGGMLLWMARGRTRVDSGTQSSPSIASAPLEHFSLTERTGEKFDSSSLKNQVWVASFFFTACPQDCMKQNLAIKDLVDEFGPRGVKFLSITCDPQRDTPFELADYADRLGAHDEYWLFLTGPFSYIQQIGNDSFNVSVEPVTHSNKLILVDRSGKVHGYFSWSDPVRLADLRSELQKMLADSSYVDGSGTIDLAGES